MSGSTAVYDMLMPPAMIGMKVDSMYDNVDSYPSADDIPFGRVCVFAGTTLPLVRRVRMSTAAGGGGLGPPAGVALQDHVVGAYGPHYRNHDAVSVLTRGRVWAEVNDVTAAIVPGTQVSYDGVTGRVRTATGGGPVALPLFHAIFRSGIIVVPPLWPSGALGGGRVALVEMNIPPYQPITTTP